MTPDRFQRIDELFSTAAAMDTTVRAAFLNEACGADVELRSEVEKLLEFDRRPREFLKTPVIAGGLQFTQGGSPVLDAPAGMPAYVGGYRILGVLGEGGFGVVYLAEQENPRRTVAVKVIKAHLASAQAMRRFEYEAQVLGRLQHPGIAQIYEAGIAELEVAPGSAESTGGDASAASSAARPGRAIRYPTPYLAMEFVRGQPLDAFADARRLDGRARLELLASVCDAVQYAHNRGVIHRDLKPANILVAEEGTETRRHEGTEGNAGRPVPHSGEPLANAGGPVSSSGPVSDWSVSPTALRASAPSSLRAFPKILDFGVARTTDPDQQLTTLHTDARQFIGTLPYMSPEQVAGDPREIDVRADVYALGVLLFQLLTGDLPIDVRNCSVPEAARKIRDESPLRAGSINRTLRGEIETIVAKALDKDRARRYQSAAELAADIRRYLHGEPIDAKRDSALYVMRKTLSRHRAAFAVAALFLTVLMVFGVVSFMQARNNRFLAEQETIAKLNAVAARNLAQEQRERADRELRISNIERGRLFGYTHNLAAAEAMLWREHLREPDLHTYWALWELYSREPLLARWTAHPDVIRTTRFSPDGALIASAGDGGVIRLWDTATRTQVAQLRGHRRPIRALAFSPHGRLLASAGVDGAIRLWNLATRDCDRILYSDARDVYALAFDRDGRRIAAGDISGELLIHNLDGPGAAVLRAGGRIEHVCFNDDGTMIAASGADGATHIWTYPDLEPRQTLRGHDGPVAFAAFSPDGQTVASGGWDRMVRLWDIASGECSAVLSTANGTIRMVHFTDNGRSLISSGWWSTDTWDIATRQRIRIMHAGMLGMNLTPDNRLVVGGQGTDLLLWDNDPDAGLIRLDGQSGRMTAAMSPDGSTVLTGDGAGAVRLWDARDGGVPREFSPHSDRVRCVQFNRDGTLTASGGSDGVLRVCEARSGAMLAEIAGYHDASADSMRFSPDGRRIAFSNARAGITLRDLDGGRSIDIPAVSAETINLCFSPDGELLASAARDGNVRIWSSADGAPRAALATDGTPWGVEFSPDGGRLAVGTWGFNVELWDVQSATRVGLLEGHRAVIWHVDWSPADPRLLASAADDGAVKLWDASQSRCLATFDDFAGQSALTVAFSPDGRYLLAAGGDGASVLRDLTHRDRHIEGNRVWHADRLRAESGAADAPGWPPVP